MEVEQRLFMRYGREVPRGTVLFRENDPGREMYIIQSGKVKISKKVRNLEKTLAILGKGDFFGEMSILNNKPRSATAEVVEDARLLVIDPQTFETMLRGNAEIAIRMIKNLAARLQEADRQIENLLLRDHTSRVVNTLSKLASEKGQQTPEGIRFELSQEELAIATAVSLEQVREILRKLVAARILVIEGDRVTIPDRDLLGRYFQYLEMKEQFEGA
jgi:CRP/FNR family cyclic AMP-dependent transcriptional regulator